jgi:hypothetical protein
MSQADKTIAKPSFEPSAAPPSDELETPPLSEPAPATQETKTRPGAVSILGLLLLLEAGGFFDLGLFFFTGGLGPTRSLVMETLLTEPIYTLAEGIIFLPLSLLSLLAAVGFFRLWRAAWVMAMLVQGLSLLTALVLYFNQQPDYVYMIMLYSIFLVVYLNTFEVQTAFEPIASLEEEENEG